MLPQAIAAFMPCLVVHSSGPGTFGRVLKKASPPLAAREDHPDPPERRLGFRAGRRNAPRFAPPRGTVPCRPAGPGTATGQRPPGRGAGRGLWPPAGGLHPQRRAGAMTPAGTRRTCDRISCLPAGYRCGWHLFSTLSGQIPVRQGAGKLGAHQLSDVAGDPLAQLALQFFVQHVADQIAQQVFVKD